MARSKSTEKINPDDVLSCLVVSPGVYLAEGLISVLSGGDCCVKLKGIICWQSAMGNPTCAVLVALGYNQLLLDRIQFNNNLHDIISLIRS